MLLVFREVLGAHVLDFLDFGVVLEVDVVVALVGLLSRGAHFVDSLFVFGDNIVGESGVDLLHFAGDYADLLGKFGLERCFLVLNRRIDERNAVIEFSLFDVEFILRFFFIDFGSLLQFGNLNLNSLLKEMAPLFFTLETPLHTYYNNKGVKPALEEQTPAIKIAVRKGEKTKTHMLTYQCFLKTPILNGSYLASFESDKIDIPYSVRLLRAETKMYPASNKPIAYKAYLEIENVKTKELDNVTLSMNRVYETRDGFRFYLSGISPQEEGSIKRIHLVVNRDPVKYYLTYPGAVLVVMGVVLLLFRRR